MTEIEPEPHNLAERCRAAVQRILERYGWQLIDSEEFVDQTVAESIHAALSKQKLPRPLSHDLMRAILQAYDGKVVQVVVTLKGATFYGALTIEVAGNSKVFDSRSSDAIALAIHFAAPIWVSRELLEKSGKPLEKEDPPGTQRL